MQTMSRVVMGTMGWIPWDTSAPSLAVEEGVQLIRDVSLNPLYRVTTLDCADIYGNGQGHKFVGEVLSALGTNERSKLQIVTKAAVRLLPAVSFKHYDASKEHIVNSVNNSLADLKTDYVDLFLVHRPDYLLNTVEVAETMYKLKTEGKVKHFGVSNFSPSQFDALQHETQKQGIDLVTNQIEFSVLNVRPLDDGTLDQAQKYRAPPMIWGPLASGRIFQSGDSHIDTIRGVLTEIADKYSSVYNDTITTDVVALAWVMKHPSNPAPVLGTVKPDRLKLAAKYAERLSKDMTREEWYKLLESSVGRCVA